MSGNVYAVVGTGGSGRGTVALDLAGAFAAAGDRTVLVELGPGGTSPLETLAPGPDPAFRSTVDDVLAGGTDPVAAVTPVEVDPFDGASLGVLPADPGRSADDTLPLDGLDDALAALRGDYDAVVLDADEDAVDPLSGDPMDGAVVASGPDAETARDASRLADRLGDRGVRVAGAVLTDCEDESDVWRAKARLATDVVAVLPPIRPDRVEVVGGRIGEVRDELVGEARSARGDRDGERSERSLAALVRGDPTRVTVPDDGDDGADPPGSEGSVDDSGDPTTDTPDDATGDGPPEPATGTSDSATGDGPREPATDTSDGATGDGPGGPITTSGDDAWTEVPVDLDEMGGRDGETESDSAFQFGELPETGGDPPEEPERTEVEAGDENPEADDGEGDDGERTDDLTDRVADILDEGEEDEATPTEWEPPEGEG